METAIWLHCGREVLYRWITPCHRYRHRRPHRRSARCSRNRWRRITAVIRRIHWDTRGNGVHTACVAFSGAITRCICDSRTNRIVTINQITRYIYAKGVIHHRGIKGLYHTITARDRDTHDGIIWLVCGACNRRGGITAVIGCLYR